MQIGCTLPSYFCEKLKTMSVSYLILLFIIVFPAGLIAGWVISKIKFSSILHRLNNEIALEKQAHSMTKSMLEENRLFKEQTENNLKAAFGTLAAEALRNNNESFVTLAETKLDQKVIQAKEELEKKEQAIGHLVKPLSEGLDKMDKKINDLEIKREGAYKSMHTVLENMQKNALELDKGTKDLVNALKNSGTRGRYGELGLRRVVEISGMTEHCDFNQQVSVQGEEGILRPDMVIHLPENKTIIIDSKTPLDAYMKAFETGDEVQKKILMNRHADAVRDHLKKLSAKAYWSQFGESPDYVVLYLQIESSFGAALQADPSLIEEGIFNNIIFATPTTLITLLRTVSFVWQQRSVAAHIEEIRDAGIELYNRTATLIEHFSKIGGSMDTVVKHYNNAIASIESRFIPQAKKLYDLGAAYTKKTLPEVSQVETAVRQLTAREQENEHDTKNE